MNQLIKDQEQRIRALDPKQSFIVQAPAGSGKTELLTQRFLVLLANVRHVPEEIVAITFTRKAASEMRSRIFEALSKAATMPAPEKPHELHTWTLARNVLQRNNLANWNLLENPNRLRITTIDALCARIAKSAPLMAHFGAVPEIVENARSFYVEAVHRLFVSLDDTDNIAKALETLLLHLDNNFVLVENLFIAMLMRRDQWLGYIMQQRNLENARELLEKGLRHVIADTLEKAEMLFLEEDKMELISLLNFAASCLKNSDNTSSAINHCLDLDHFPNSELSSHPAWQGLVELLLTKAGEWRRTVNKNVGFPAASDAVNEEEAWLFKNMKQHVMQCINKFSENQSLKMVLNEILLLPPATYTEKQWQMVSALIEILPVLVAHLNVVFQEQNVTDFIAIAEGAVYALGSTDAPSDVALNLDYQIQHLLVDEFQDTSVTQYRLLELLIAGWEQHDGRTLFLVGDPMQSIYRFREAEVGLFLKVKKFGIGNLKPTSLILEVNFRSQSTIVDWFNNTLSSVFPQEENSDLGAITFAPSIAFGENNDVTSTVTIHPFIDSGENEEARHVCSLVKKEIASNAQQSIAILVRSRSHLQTIIPELKKENIPFQAIEIEKLIFSPAVRDLFALTKALSHIGDRLAWLAILRAPWCGLTLADLYVIANFDKNATIWFTLKQYKKLALSVDAIKRLQRLVPILEEALVERGRQNLRDWIAYTWYTLGGPACLDEYYETSNTNNFLNLLANISHYSEINFSELEAKLFQSYSQHEVAAANVNLMTIHKAKGLEFDVVIIPALEKKPAIDQNQLLLWLERQRMVGDSDLILAPIRAMEDESDPIYRYLRNINSQKSYNEITRLLYVAITRAKRTLHLLGSLESNTANFESIKEPIPGSFLYLLWPKIQTQFFDQIENNASLEKSIEPVNFLKRLTLNWQPPNNFIISDRQLMLSKNEFTWTLHYQHHIGTVLHALLQGMSIRELLRDGSQMIDNEKKYWRKRFAQLGVVEQHLEICLQVVSDAIMKTLNDSRGRWILNHAHREADSEVPITLHQDNKVVHYIIDRTFVDENNVRWIIDYKTSEPLEVSIENLLINAKTKYGLQLENYAKAMRHLDQRPIKLGIYFPLFSGWCEWDYNS